MAGIVPKVATRTATAALGSKRDGGAQGALGCGVGAGARSHFWAARCGRSAKLALFAAGRRRVLQAHFLKSTLPLSLFLPLSLSRHTFSKVLCPSLSSCLSLSLSLSLSLCLRLCRVCFAGTHSQKYSVACLGVA